MLFFSSDDARLRAAVLERHPRAIVSQTVPVHVGNVDNPRASDERAALASSLADWWLLAQVDAQLISSAGGAVKSGFARTAIVASASGVYHADGDCTPCCQQRQIFCHRGLQELGRTHGAGV